jgi:hypothetical protein
MAFHDHIQWGTHLNFTYGPLGFLNSTTLYYLGTALLATTYLALVHCLFFGLILVHLARKVPKYMVLPVAYLLGSSLLALLDPGDLLMALSVLIGAAGLSPEGFIPVRAALASLGAIAAFGVLDKLSVGILALAVGIIVALFTEKWWQGAALCGFCFLATAPVLWVITGNHLSNLPDYLRFGLATVQGFPGAMSVGGKPLAEAATTAAGCAAIASFVATGYLGTPTRVRVCAYLVFLAYV